MYNVLNGIAEAVARQKLGAAGGVITLQASSGEVAVLETPIDSLGSKLGTAQSKKDAFAGKWMDKRGGIAHQNRVVVSGSRCVMPETAD